MKIAVCLSTFFILIFISLTASAAPITFSSTTADVARLDDGSTLTMAQRMDDGVVPIRVLNLTSGVRSRTIAHLSELAGHVQIRTAENALDYVRFGSTPITMDLDLGRGSEIVSRSRAARLPTYGLHVKPKMWSKVPSGAMGVLSDKAFAKCGFSKPVVAKQGKKFVITRWTAGYDKSHRLVVRHIREIVALDGSYRVDVLESRPAPTLPDGKWNMNFMVARNEWFTDGPRPMLMFRMDRQRTRSLRRLQF